MDCQWHLQKIKYTKTQNMQQTFERREDQLQGLVIFEEKQILHEKEMKKKIQIIQSKIKKGTLWSDKVKMDQDAEKKQDIEDQIHGQKLHQNLLILIIRIQINFFENLEKQQSQPKKVQANLKKSLKEMIKQINMMILKFYVVLFHPYILLNNIYKYINRYLYRQDLYKIRKCNSF